VLWDGSPPRGGVLHIHAMLSRDASASAQSKRSITISYQFQPISITIDSRATLDDLKEAILRNELLRTRSLTNMSALDEVQLKKNGEVLKKLKSPKRKKARSLKRLGFVNGDAISVLLPAIQDDLTSGEEKKLHTALLSVSLRRTQNEGGVSSSFTHDISTWELPPKEITIFPQQLGSGTYGSVFRGEVRGSEVAVKCISLPVGSDAQEQSERLLASFRNECAIMTKLLHPNVLTLMGVCIEEKQSTLMLVMELMAGSVYSMLHNDEQEPLPFKKRMSMARDCCLGMNYLHCASPPILHLDLKTHNLLVNEQGVTKVADFGLSRVSSKNRNNTTGPVGTPIYTAPELFVDAETPIGTKADVYSFGIILWELLTCHVPYPEINDLKEIYDEIVIKGKRPPIPDNCPTKLAELMAQCWNADPEARPSFSSILQSHVLDEVIIDEVISPPNEAARVFWKTRIAKVENTVGWNIRKIEKCLSASWSVFIKKLIHFCELQGNQKTIKREFCIRALRLLLVNRTGEVTIERFAEILEWFGPFTGNGADFLSMIDSITRLPGFFGDDFKDQKALANIMAGKEVGSYLIRFSSHVGSYTITAMAAKGAMMNQRIDRSPEGGFLVRTNGATQTFGSIGEIIEVFKSSWNLKEPVMPSRYSQLHKEEPNTSIYTECMGTTSIEVTPVISATAEKDSDPN